MARINFEDRWWTGAHRKKLIKLAGSEELADGIAAGWWRIAQEYWGNGRKPVPTEVFDLIEAGPKLIQAKLARVEADGVYATGSAEAFDWLNDKREAGRRGGKKSAERPRDAKGRLQKKPKQKPSEVQAENQAESKCVQPSGSGSGSYSGSTSVETFPSETAKTSFSANQFMAAYCERFKAKWGFNPPYQDKNGGIAKRLVKNLSREKADLYLDAYFAMPDAWLIKTKHPLGAFETKLNEIAAFATTGQFTTQRQMRQADDVATTHSLLQQVREGKV